MELERTPTQQTYFWIQIHRKDDSPYLDDVQSDIDNWVQRLYQIGAPAVEYTTYCRSKIIALRFQGVHLAEVKSALIHALLAGHFDKGQIGRLHLGRDKSGRPYVEYPYRQLRRYLDVPQKAFNCIPDMEASATAEK